jgi:hypothetical protein
MIRRRPRGACHQYYDRSTAFTHHSMYIGSGEDFPFLLLRKRQSQDDDGSKPHSIFFDLWWWLLRPWRLEISQCLTNGPPGFFIETAQGLRDTRLWRFPIKPTNMGLTSEIAALTPPTMPPSALKQDRKSNLLFWVHMWCVLFSAEICKSQLLLYRWLYEKKPGDAWNALSAEFLKSPKTLEMTQHCIEYLSTAM